MIGHDHQGLSVLASAGCLHNPPQPHTSLPLLTSESHCSWNHTHRKPNLSLQWNRVSLLIAPLYITSIKPQLSLALRPPHCPRQQLPAFLTVLEVDQGTGRPNSTQGTTALVHQLCRGGLCPFAPCSFSLQMHLAAACKTPWKSGEPVPGASSLQRLPCTGSLLSPCGKWSVFLTCKSSGSN